MLLLQSFRLGRSLVAVAEEFAWSNGCARIEVTSGDYRSDAHPLLLNHRVQAR